MRFLTLNGRVVNKNFNRYLIKWDKEEASHFQTNVKKFLEPFIRTHIVYSEFPLVGRNRMRIDIFDATTRIAYEICGKQHLSFNKHFHKGIAANYLAQIKRDQYKIDFCELNNIKLINIYDETPLTKEFFKEKFDITL